MINWPFAWCTKLHVAAADNVQESHILTAEEEFSENNCQISAGMEANEAKGEVFIFWGNSKGSFDFLRTGMGFSWL